MSQPKYYVVWNGREPGIYRTWEDCQRQVVGFPAAVYKSFKSEAEAKRAFEAPATDYVNVPTGRSKTSEEDRTQRPPQVTAPKGCPPPPPDYRHDTVLPLPLEVKADALAVDAACSATPAPWNIGEST